MVKASRKWIKTAIALSALLPLVAAAQGTINNGAPPGGSGYAFSNVLTSLNLLITWVYTVFLVFAVIFAVIAAFKYLTAGGDPEKVKGASQMLIYVAVAIAVALLSVAIQFLMKELLGVS